eukprot:snap_masked-scaffold_37-processed-gene-2.46-mRNA-1 protein AED:1.00 eAED:1.00 QI:0/0/0/0/1/1/2/0/66
MPMFTLNLFHKRALLFFQRIHKITLDAKLTRKRNSAGDGYLLNSEKFRGPDIGMQVFTAAGSRESV